MARELCGRERPERRYTRMGPLFKLSLDFCLRIFVQTATYTSILFLTAGEWLL